MSLKSKIESLLYISIKPLSAQKIAELLKVEAPAVDEALLQIEAEINNPHHGIHLMQIGRKYTLATASDNAPVIQQYLKDEQRGELTRPALEALTIIAYRGPIAKSDLDAIRGVNCALILRNLMIKGLIEAYEDKKDMATFYQVTFDFLRYLGINRATELPDYEKLNRDESLEKLLALEGSREAEAEPKEI